MASLHSIQHSYDDQNWLDRCLELAATGDAILLLEDAVSLCCHQPSINKLVASDKSLSLYILNEDLKARGLTLPSTGSAAIEFTLISYQEFVELSLQYERVVNWA